MFNWWLTPRPIQKIRFKTLNISQRLCENYFNFSKKEIILFLKFHSFELLNQKCHNLNICFWLKPWLPRQTNFSALKQAMQKPVWTKCGRVGKAKTAIAFFFIINDLLVNVGDRIPDRPSVKFDLYQLLWINWLSFICWVPTALLMLSNKS